MSDVPRPAKLAFFFGLAAVVVPALGAAAAYWGVLPPYRGFMLFGLGIPLAVLAVIFGIVGFAKSRHVPRGLVYAAIGDLLGFGFLIVVVFLVAPTSGAPPIHDITTDPDDPPEFREIAKLPENAGRDLTYPHGGAEVTAAQKSAYPDVRPIELAVTPGEAFEAAQNAVEELGWTVVWSNRALGIIEASETSGVFRFVDDVSIRVREVPGGAVIDLRSTSRVGVSDLGANAARILAFAERVRP